LLAAFLLLTAFCLGLRGLLLLSPGALAPGRGRRGGNFYGCRGLFNLLDVRLRGSLFDNGFKVAQALIQ